MTQSPRNQPSKQTNISKCRPSRWTVVLHSKLELLWRLNGEKASLLLPRLSPVNSSLFFLDNRRTTQPSGLQRLWTVCLGRNASDHVTFAFVKVSRYVIHHDNISNTLADQLQLMFWTVAFEFCPLHCFRKRYVRKMAKKEVADVFRCYLPNLRRFWIVKLPFVTLWPVTILQETSRLLSRRFLQDFAIYNRAHFCDMI